MSTQDQLELAGYVQRTFDVKSSPSREHVANDTADRPAIIVAPNALSNGDRPRFRDSFCNLGVGGPAFPNVTTGVNATGLAVMNLGATGLRGMAAVIMGNIGAEPVRTQINTLVPNKSPRRGDFP